MIKYILIILLAKNFISFSIAANYTLKDLEYLESEKNYKEFLDHALDVLPSDRNSHWKDMVYNMSEKYVSQSTKKKLFSRKQFRYINKISKWPVLINDEIFQINRAKFSISYLKQCFNTEKEICRQELDNFWKETNLVFVNLELGPELAKIVKNNYPAANVFKYYSYLYKNEFSGPLCKRDDVVNTFLEMWVSRPKTDKLEPLNIFIKPNCLKEFAATLKKYMLEDKNNFKVISYQILMASNLLTPVERDLFLSTYILSKPKVGKIFNLSWASIIDLGRDYKKRDQVFTKLKKLDPLPDQVLFHKDKQTILQFFSKNFPEYFNYYAKTCINYLSGRVKFKNGAPTLSCHELFRLSNKIKIINDKYLKSYSSLL